MNSNCFTIVARTLDGLEDLLAAELHALGARQIQTGRRVVTFQGDQRLLYAANLHCRLAIRILKPIHTFTATKEKELYDGVQVIDWSKHLDSTGTLAIDSLVRSSFCTHSLFASQLTKDAIVDQLRELTGKRPSVDKDSPDLQISVLLRENNATIYLDSSGESLHKRGYRSAATEAPLNEVLAAGILKIIQWDMRTPIVDPMCGSGTILIEAALAARNIAPGLLGHEFGFERWKDFDEPLWTQLVDEADKARLPKADCKLFGSDLDESAVKVARRNARQAGVEADIEFGVSDFDVLVPPVEQGILFMNPPYDERMKISRISERYQRIGDVLKKSFAGFSAHILTGNLEAAKHIGLRSSQKTVLFNGPIECRLIKIDLYRGSSKTAESKEPSPDDVVADSAQIEASANVEVQETEAAQPKQSEVKQPAVVRPLWQKHADEFTNRLERMAKHWQKWARRQNITCFRVYDCDVAIVPLVIEWYEDNLVISEYKQPNDRSEIEDRQWRRFMIESAVRTLQADPKKVFFKERERKTGPSQYERGSDRGKTAIVSEAGLKFRINLSDYLDTGLFLDHRATRSMVREVAAGKRFLNLFAYTGSFTVYAASGGAASTTTVDTSNTYLDRATENLKLNNLASPKNAMVREDVITYLRDCQRSNGPRFDLAVVDPPTFSNTKKEDRIWDVQKDHPLLLRLLKGIMTDGAKVYFSTNFRRFKLAEEEIGTMFEFREITKQTIPPDFRDKRIHRCWLLTRKANS